MKKVITLVLYCIYIQSFAQYKLKATIQNMPIKKVWFIAMVGDKQKLIDTTYSTSTGEINFPLKKQMMFC